MQTYKITTRNLTIKNESLFSIDFDIFVGAERIKSIAGGAAIDGYDYLMVSDPTGETREFGFDFSGLKKTITSFSVVNIVIRITDVDDHISEWGFCKNYAVESGFPHIGNPRISQRRDGSGLIDIKYDYSSPYEIAPAIVVIALSSDNGKTWSVPVSSMTGDVGEGCLASSHF